MTDTAVTTIRRDEVLTADPLISMIERVVMSPDADLDKLERMLAMKERMDAQTAKIAFAHALAAARAEIPPIIKDAKVDFTGKTGIRTNYQHETLAGIAKVIDPILSKHGLSYRYRTGQGQGGVTVTCVIQHSAGYAEETSLSGSPDGSGNKNGFQAVGSAVTYLQRYTLKAALGLSAEVDDDAQSAAPRDDAAGQEPRPSAASKDAITSAIDCLAAAETLGDLRDVWVSLSKPVQHVPAVEAAKDARKEALEAPAETRNADIGNDEIPY